MSAVAFEMALESALAAAQRALRVLEAAEPSAATVPAARSVRRAIGALLDAVDGRTTTRSGLDRAGSMLTFAFAALGGDLAGDGGVEEGASSPEAVAVALAAESTVAAQRQASPDRLDAPPGRPADRTPPRFRVSEHAPRLVDLPRPSLLPPDAIRLPPAPPPPAERQRDPVTGLDEVALLAQAAALGAQGAILAERTNEAAAALAPAGARPKGDLEVGALLDDAPAPLTEVGFVRALAREHFEDVGMFGLQRLPLFGDDFASIAVIEARLLASCDALLGLGAPSIAELERLARDTPAPEPMRVFAMGFVGGVLEGRDGLAAAERTLHAHDPHDEGIAEALGAALALAPNPLTDRVLVGMARADEPAVRAAAIRALARRGPIDVALLVEAGESDAPEVVAAALPALAVARHPHAAELVAQLAIRHRARSEPALAMALWHALALAGHEEAAAAPRAHLDGPLGDPAAIALAVVGDAADAEALLAAARRAPTPARLVALGWAGAIEAAPFLIESLADDALAVAAARALERLLGGVGLAHAEVDPESLDTMEPVLVRSPSLMPRSTLAALIQGAEEDPEASPDRVLLPSMRAAAWKERLGELQGKLPRRGAGLRIRRGEPYRPAQSLAELGLTGADLPPSFAERQLLARELTIRTGRPFPFSAEDLVTVQRRHLADGQALLGGPPAAGSFTRPLRGRG